MKNSPDCILLFSGGLDSLIAARVLMNQGLQVHCLHLYTPFYGKPKAIHYWKRLYGVDVEALDLSAQMVALIEDWPAHGFGKVMNPCVDCKILQLRTARKRMEELGARFIATGEVLGQRPMSQRRDVLNTIRREAGVNDILLRPLSALHLDPTPMELSGLVRREKLLDIQGRGRLDQLALAQQYQFPEIPSPGGGCLLTERENARRYWPLRSYRKGADLNDYQLSGVGRQVWRVENEEKCWLIIGRNNKDNESIKALQRSGDFITGLCDYPGPLSLLRDGEQWSKQAVQEALALIASYSPKGIASGDARLRFWLKQKNGEQIVLSVEPNTTREGKFLRMSFEEVKAEKHELARARALEEEALREARRAHAKEKKFV